MATVERVFTLFGSMHVVPAVGGESGGLLPDLRNPATDLDIRLGMEAIDENGGVLVGAMPEKEAASYVPSLSEQHIPSGQFLKGEQTIRPVTGTLLAQLDPEFIPSNIRKGTDLFGVAGAYEETPVIEPLSITENGTYAAPSGVDGYSPVTVNVAASGGFELPEPKLLCTLTAEMNLKEILTANPIPRKYKRSLVFFLHSGENVASQGGMYRNIIFYCTPVNGGAGPNFMAQHYNISAVAPDSMNPGCTGGVNGTYFSISDDGSLTASGTTNTTRYFAVGNTIHYIEIPFNYETLTMDTTEWGAS